jgi:predicted DsbA family dithiol-disulfide isomerase
MEQSSLVRLKSEFDVEVSWRGFELHPETPIGGIAVTDLFRNTTLEKIRKHISRFGAEFGVEILVPEHLSNTRRALAMSEFARDQGRLEAFREEAMRAYWQEQADLEKEQVLRSIAMRAGLDQEEALLASTSDNYVNRVRMPVVGCQRYETFEKMAERAGATRRSS